MMDKGHSRDSVQCRVKVKKLRQAYQKTKEANRRCGAGPKTCRFYAELHAILGGCATSSPPLSVDSDVGVVIAMAEDDADGEEYDEEADEDDLAESTQHSISPNSQELFLTQTELASQPSQDNEAMEETSAANFSSLPTPSQRLSKIRWRKKKTREEMFSDIMEVTRKERAHLNEWKEVVSKYRKDASEREDRRDTRDERYQQEDQRWRQEDQWWRDAILGLLHDQTDMLWHLVDLQERQQDHRVPLHPLADEGQVKEEKGRYTYFWKGKSIDEPQLHGVGFAIKNKLARCLSKVPVGINERFMTLQLRLTKNQQATIVRVYALTLDTNENVKEDFYSQLETILSETPTEDKIILLGDFNARMG
ncbi:uncharacterized protein ACDP82_006090 [Pangshura tecta]